MVALARPLEAYFSVADAAPFQMSVLVPENPLPPQGDFDGVIIVSSPGP